jgi:hypothetical protein
MIDKPTQKSRPGLVAKIPVSRWTWHPLTLFVLATIATTAAGTWLWRNNESELLDRGAFQLTWERIEATPPPQYLQTDLRKVAFDGSRLADLNLLDHDLVRKVHAAFAVQSWVQQVSVQKNRQAVHVDVIYRDPVALVEFGDNLLLPVDREAVVLDGDQLDPEFASHLLRISVYTPQVGSIVNGEVWPDQRVVAAAMIADLIRARASEWGVARIAHVPLVKDSLAAEGDFEFMTSQGPAGIRVMWGSPPGFERTKEASAKDKLETLEKWIAERGALSEIGTSQTIDLRAGKIELISGQ